MASVNIPASLNTTTQIPVDAKTYKKYITEINAVTQEQAFTYYVGMRVDVAQNNKQYIWKEIEPGDVVISNTIVYPSGLIVDGYDYSNKSFAFVEVIVTVPTPEPSNDIKYRTRVYNIDYTPEPDPNPDAPAEYYESIVKEYNTTEPNENNESYEEFGLSPLSSKTLMIYRTPSSIHNAYQASVPIRIEYHPLAPQNSVIVGDGGQYSNMHDALIDGVESITVADGTGSIYLPAPIADNVTITFPSNPVQIQTPSPSSPIFAGGGKKNINIPHNGVLITSSPLASISSASVVTFSGGGSIQSANMSSPLIKTSSVINVVGATEASNIATITFDNIKLDLTNTTLAEIEANTAINILNTDVYSDNNTKPIIKNTGGVVKIKNIDIKFENSNSSTIVEVLDGGLVDIKNIETVGDIGSISKVTRTAGYASDIKINNIDVSASNVTVLVDTSLPVDTLNLANVTINNTVSANDSTISTLIEGAVINNYSTTTTGVVNQFRAFKSRVDAAVELPINTLFINKSIDNDDESKWFIDVVI